MDDEEMIRDLSNQILTRLGYDTEVCKDGSEAIRMYEKARESEEPFDAVILDLTNELGMGGKEAMRRLLEIDPEVKGIVATGYSNDPVVTKFREYGFCGALPKPYTMDELSMTLYDVISGEPYRMEGQISDVHKSAYDNERTSEKKR
jgi:DNA-binding NtrC family response regulator